MTRSPYVVHTEALGSVQLLRDAASDEQFDETQLKQHFKNIHTLLLDRVTDIQHSHTSLSEHEEKELYLMLDALIQAKRLLADQ